MSIENNLASIAKSLEAIALAMTERKQSQLYSIMMIIRRNNCTVIFCLIQRNPYGTG